MDTPYRGQFVKDADPALIDALARFWPLVQGVDSTHSYPHCWRCGTPLIYWAKPEWFARTSAHKHELLRENETIGWHPDHIKHGRFGDWLENNVDWALSRDRFWGTPIPIWRCDACGPDTCVGSVEELAALAGKDLGDLDLHRPDVDDVVINCPKCRSGARERVEPVLDVWFDSGAMPAAQFHYPFENDDDFERRFPADFICEAIDQTRGWFYSLLAVNTLVFGRAPYRNVVCLALLLDEDGQNMSKSRGNAIDPWTILETRGADALRWNFVSSSSPWTPKRVSLDGIDESTRRFLVTLWETYRSSSRTRTSTAGTPTAPMPADGAPSTHVLDRWIRSRLHATVEAVTDSLEGFDALARRAGARGLRRRSLELVRAPVAAALLERRWRRRFGCALHAARVPAHRRVCSSRRTARSSPTTCTRTWRAARSPCISPTGPLPMSSHATSTSKTRWHAPAPSCRSACRRATNRS